jgi:hypothetical protein
VAWRQKNVKTTFQEGFFKKRGVNNTYLSVIEACFKNRRFPEEIMHAGAI